MRSQSSPVVIAEDDIQEIFLSNHESQTASVSGVVFNLSTSMVGAGMMSMPMTLKVLGILPALSLILFVAFLCDISVEFLLRYTGRVGMSYAEVMNESFGRIGAVFLQICITLNNVGGLIIYLIIIGDVLSGTKSGDGVVHLGVLQEWFGGEQWWNQRTMALLFTLIFILLPFLFLRRLDSLRFSSAVSVFLAVIFVVITSVIAVNALSRGAIQIPRLLPDKNLSFFNLFTVVPVIVIAFTFHFNVHPMRAEMSTTSDMPKAVRLSLIFCSMIYGTIGFSGYLLFGEATTDDILSNFDITSSTGVGISPFLNDVIRLSYALHLMLVFPVMFFALRINVYGLVFPNADAGGREFQDQGFWFFYGMTMVLVVSVYLAAISIPNIWIPFQFFGSTTSVCISFIFPAAVVLQDVDGISGRKDKILAMGMMAVAVATSCITMSTNVVNFF